MFSLTKQHLICSAGFRIIYTEVYRLSTISLTAFFRPIFGRKVDLTI